MSDCRKIGSFDVGSMLCASVLAGLYGSETRGDSRMSACSIAYTGSNVD